MPHSTFSLTVSGLLFALSTIAAANPPSGYQQVFRDDFAYGTDSNGHIDFRGNWFYHPPEARRWEAGDGWNTADAASIKNDGEDGNALSLKVYTDSSKPAEQQTRGAAISTWDYSVPNKDNAKWAYGYFEARIKYPATASASWSSFWLFNFDWDGGQKESYLGQTEIDIMEFREHSPEGNRLNRNEIFSNVHFGWDAQIGAWSQNTAMTISEPGFNPREFNTYGLLWSEKGYDVFINGRYVHSMPTKVNVWDYNTKSNVDLDILYTAPHALFLSTEMRPGFTGPAEDPNGYGTQADPKTEMIIDYVAVYQKNGESSDSGTVTPDNSPMGNPNGEWSEHPSLGWLYNAGNGWQFSLIMNEWYWIDSSGQWGWAKSNGWHWLDTPGWIYRYSTSDWFQII